MVNQVLPFQKKTVLVAPAIPLISYADFTAAERVYQSNASWEAQKEDDTREMTIVTSVAKALNIPAVEAMGVYMHVLSYLSPDYDTNGVKVPCPYGVPDRTELAAVKMAELEHREKPKDVIYEQYAFYLNSRTDLEAFDKKAFEDEYGIEWPGSWTVELVEEIPSIHPPLQQFLLSEARGTVMAEPEPATPGEPTAA
jgi:hypothetical protein